MFYYGNDMDKIEEFLMDCINANINVDSHAQTLIMCIADTFHSLCWFWSFIHKETAMDDEAVYKFHRGCLLDTLCEMSVVMNSSWHNFTNHLIEDFKNWDPLYFLLGEGSEASHTRDNHMK